MIQKKGMTGITSDLCYYWVGQDVPYISFCKRKNTFFTFTNNFIDLDILSMLSIAHYWLLVGRGQGCCYTSANA